MTMSGAHDAAMPKPVYDALRAQLEFRPSLAMNLLTVGMNLALFGAIVWLLARGNLASYWIAQLLLPIAMFQAFSLLHECGHGNLSRSRLVNTLVGHYASVLCCMPYFPWKYVHAEHHVWAGNVERDPGLELVRRARRGQLPWLLVRTWKTWLPIPALVQHIVYWANPIVELRRGKMQRSRAWRCAASVGFLIAVYAGLHLLEPSLFTILSFLPGILLYLIMVEVVNTPHHVGLTAFDERLPLRDQHLPTRTCDYPPVVSELLVLNFNFHIEHHMFPNLPWYRLRAARALVQPALGFQYRQAHGVEWLRRARKRELLDVLTVKADDFESLPPVRAPHRREVPT